MIDSSSWEASFARLGAPGGVTVAGVESSDVTAVPAAVVAEVLADPDTFFRHAMEAAPGWATRYGGPEGVMQLTTVLQDDLARRTKVNAALRGAAFRFARTHDARSLEYIAQRLGISRMSVTRAMQRAAGSEEMFPALEEPGAWGPDVTTAR